MLKPEKEIKSLFSEMNEALGSWIFKKKKYLPSFEYLSGAFDAFAWILGYQLESSLKFGILHWFALKEKAEKGKISHSTKAKLKELLQEVSKENEQKFGQYKMRRREFFTTNGELID